LITKIIIPYNKENNQMKGFLRVLVVVVAVAILGVVPAYAKKDKGGGPQIPPVITAEQAKATVTAAAPNLSLGKPYTKQGKRGDIKLEVPLLVESKVVGRVHLNPLTGEILTKGQKIQAPKLSVSPEEAAKTVQTVLPQLQVGAAWLGKGGEWKIPLLYKGAIIAEMNVHGQNGSLLPDWKASKDAAMFGK